MKLKPEQLLRIKKKFWIQYKNIDIYSNIFIIDLRGI